MLSKNTIWFLATSVSCFSALAQECDPTVSQTIPGSHEEVLGSSIELMGDKAIIGAYAGVANGIDTGVAYLYAFDGEQWIETDRFVPPHGASEDWFGLYIAADQDRMLIGSVGHDDGGSNVGAVYAYTLIDGRWEYEQKLSPIYAVVDGGFGVVDIEGSRAVIGAPGHLFAGPVGSVTAFEYGNEQWDAMQIITPTDAQPGDLFGVSVSFAGDRLIIGASKNFDETQWSSAGSAYIYKFNGEEWLEQAKLVPADLFAPSDFGRAVWIKGDRAVVGAPGANNGIGRVYCYQLIAGQWIEQQIIEPESQEINTFFGIGLSIDDDVMVVAKGGGVSDEAYIYRRVNNRWEPAGALESNENGQFGVVLDVQDDTAMLISLSKPENNGSVVVYNLGCSPCPADFTGDGILNSNDVAAFLDAYGDQDLISDFNNDGVLNFFDVSAFLAEFAAGC